MVTSCHTEELETQGVSNDKDETHHDETGMQRGACRMAFYKSVADRLPLSDRRTIAFFSVCVIYQL